MFLFPRACRVCRLAKKKGMIDCLDCMSTTYCSEQHRDEHAEKHGKFCPELKYAMVCDNFESTVSIAAPPIPAKIDQQYLFDPTKTMREHLIK